MSNPVPFFFQTPGLRGSYGPRVWVVRDLPDDNCVTEAHELARLLCRWGEYDKSTARTLGYEFSETAHAAMLEWLRNRLFVETDPNDEP